MSDQEPNRGEKRLQDIDRRIAKMQGDREDAANRPAPLCRQEWVPS